MCDVWKEVESMENGKHIYILYLKMCRYTIRRHRVQHYSSAGWYNTLTTKRYSTLLLAFKTTDSTKPTDRCEETGHQAYIVYTNDNHTLLIIKLVQ